MAIHYSLKAHPYSVPVSPGDCTNLFAQYWITWFASDSSPSYSTETAGNSNVYVWIALDVLHIHWDVHASSHTAPHIQTPIEPQSYAAVFAFCITVCSYPQTLAYHLWSFRHLWRWYPTPRLSVQCCRNQITNTLPVISVSLFPSTPPPTSLSHTRAAKD